LNLEKGVLTMEKNSFFKTKEGGLTLAFIVIMIAFAFRFIYRDNRSLCSWICDRDGSYVLFTGESVYLNTKT